MAQSAEKPAKVTGGYTRFAELKIDLARAEPFNAALREAIATAVRVEPGCLALYAVADKTDPSIIRVFEIYTDEAAYRSHIETPHFRKFVEATRDIVISRKLSDVIPIILGDKSN